MRRQRLSDCAYDEVHPTFKLVADRLPRALATAMRDDPSIMDTMVRAGRARLNLYNGRYMRIEDQGSFWFRVNRDLRWGLNENELREAVNQACRRTSDDRNDETAVEVIVPRLPETDPSTPGVKRTFLALWELAQRNMAGRSVDGNYTNFDIRTCFYTNKPILTDGNPYRPGFSLEVIRWTKEVGKSSRRVTGVVVNNEDRPVDAGGLACAVLHPDWLRQYSCIEPVKLTGYAVNVQGSDDQDCVPILTYYGDDEDCIKLGLHRRLTAFDLEFAQS